MTMLCKRTDYPKLGYIIHRLDEMGIACSFEYGKDGREIRSFHADHILMVESQRFDEAWKLLGEKWSMKRGCQDTRGKTMLDEMPDDHPAFVKYADVEPMAEEPFDPVAWGWVGKDGRP